MKTGVVLLGILGLSGLSAAAAAQGAPPARTGFQMDVRTGYSIPMGKLAGEAKLSDQLSGQVPIIIDIGGKVIPELFVGGYLGFAFGGAGSAADAFCKGNGQSCTALSLHLGALIQYHILPAGAVNPWVGYGIGVESLGQGRTVGGNTTTTTLTGFEFARLMGGADFRISEVFGVGPFIDLSFAQYSQAKSGGASVDIPNTAMHEWLTLGVRGVFFP